MGSHHFHTGKRLKWDGKVWEITRTFPDKTQFNLTGSETGETKTVSYKELVDALFTGVLAFAEESLPAPHKKPPVFRYRYRDLRDAPQRIQTLVRFRVWVIEPLLDLPDRSLVDVEARVNEVRQLLKSGERLPKEIKGLSNPQFSVASVYRWIAVYDESDRDRRALVDNSEKRGGGTRLEKVVNDIVMEAISQLYLTRTPDVPFDIWGEIRLRVQEYNEANATDYAAPSLRTIHRRIETLETQRVARAHQGDKATRRSRKQYRQMNYPTRPLAVMEIDDTTIDLVVIDDEWLIPLGRSTLSVALDQSTRYPLGYYNGFEPSSYLTAMECLYHAICPKGDVKSLYGTQNDWLAYGVPETLVVDNARHFTGNDLEQSAYDLGTELVFAPAACPEFKGSVERFFRTANEGIVHRIPGTTFSNILKRGDYNSKEQACITLSDFNRILHLFFVDYYAERYHRGLDDIPARCWEDALSEGFQPRLPANLEDPTILLGRVAHRKLHAYGIEIHNLYYNCDNLLLVREHVKLAQRTGWKQPPGIKPDHVRIKYHPGDLSHIYVYDPIDKHYIKVPAKAQNYTAKLSLWQHRIIRRQSQLRFQSTNVEALARTKRKIREVIEESKQGAKLAARARVARYKSGGRSATHQKNRVEPKQETITVVEPKVGTQSRPSQPEQSFDLGSMDLTGWETGDDLPR
jgi:putative transposase